MERINLADAKTRLSGIVDRVEAGESIEISRCVVSPFRPVLQFGKEGVL